MIAKQIVAYLHNEAKAILPRQGIKDSIANPYLFNILKPGCSIKEKVEKIDAWKRLTNRTLNRIGKRLNLRISLNLYSARHSWATMMKLNSVALLDISDGLGHSNTLITSNYLGSLVTDKIKTMSDML